MTPCTVTIRLLSKVRGGKNFEVRYQAELAAQAKHTEQYCGAVSDRLTWGVVGALRSATARPEAELFAASCTMPEVLGAPQRFVAASVVNAAVTPCSS